MKYSRVILTAAAASLALAQQVAQPIGQQPPQYVYNQQAAVPPQQQQMRPDPDSPTIVHQAPQVQQQQASPQQQAAPQQPQYVNQAAPQVIQQQAAPQVIQQQAAPQVIQQQAASQVIQQQAAPKQVVQPPVMQQGIGRPLAPEGQQRQQAQPVPNVQQAPPVNIVPIQQAAVGAAQYQQQVVQGGVQYQQANPAQVYAAQQPIIQQAGAVPQSPIAPAVMQGNQKPVMAQPLSQGPGGKVGSPYSGQAVPSINDQAIMAQQMAAARQQQALYGNAGVPQQQPIYVNQGVPVQQQYNAGGAMQYDHPHGNIYNNAPKVVGVKPAVSAPPPMMVDASYTEADPASSIAADWDKHMQNFMPQMILTFRLNGGEAEHFHQDVTIPGTLIRGGFFESTTEGAPGTLNNAAKGGSRRHIGFKILSPSGKLLFSSDKSESLFRVDCSEVGTYTFAISSASWSKSKFVTFVMGTGEVSPLTGSDISSIDGNIKMLYRMLSEIETHNNLLWTRHRAQAEQIRKTSNKTYYAFIIELLCTAAAIIAQLATVKKMISKRSMF